MEDGLEYETDNPMNILCVGQLPQNVSAAEIFELFKPFGRVLDVSLGHVAADSSNFLPTQNAKLYFERVENINKIMANRPFQIHGNEIFLRRFIPQSFNRGNQSQKVTNKIMVTTSSDSPAEILPGNHFIKIYLSEIGGAIENYERLDDKIAFVEFVDYDAVDIITSSRSQHYVNNQRIFIDRYFDDSEFRSSIEYQQELNSGPSSEQQPFLSDEMADETNWNDETYYSSEAQRTTLENRFMQMKLELENTHNQRVAQLNTEWERVAEERIRTRRSIDDLLHDIDEKKRELSHLRKLFSDSLLEKPRIQKEGEERLQNLEKKSKT